MQILIIHYFARFSFILKTDFSPIITTDYQSITTSLQHLPSQCTIQDLSKLALSLYTLSIPIQYIQCLVHACTVVQWERQNRRHKARVHAGCSVYADTSAIHGGYLYACVPISTRVRRHLLPGPTDPTEPTHDSLGFVWGAERVYTCAHTCPHVHNMYTHMQKIRE